MKTQIKYVLLILLCFTTVAQAKEHKRWQIDAIHNSAQIVENYITLINRAGWEFNTPTRLITAIMTVESGGNPHAVAESCVKRYARIILLGKKKPTEKWEPRMWSSKKSKKRVPQKYIDRIMFSKEKLTYGDAALKWYIDKYCAKGLMQTKKIIDKETSIYGDSFNPLTSIRKASKYLEMLRDIYGFSSLEELIVAYYEGPTRAREMREQKKDFTNHFYYKKVAFALQNMPLKW